MAADEYNDSDQFSDDDVYDNLGENDFDVFETDRRGERAELANAFKDDSESGDELDDGKPAIVFYSATFWVDRWGTLLWHETYLWCPVQMCTET